MSRGIACLSSALAFLCSLAVMAVSATACEGGGGGGAELTTLATKLSGEGKESEEVTVLEGSKVTDKATLSGNNASKATGKVAYKVYSDKECKTLVTSAGEVTVSGESVPASSEEELAGGKTYYWQAHYGGDAKNAESTSPCTEVLNVKPVVCTFPYCEPTITPGVKVFLGTGACTAGPILTSGAEQFLLTAGHCLQKTSVGTETVKQKVESAYPKEEAVKKDIGEDVTFNNTAAYDIAEVKIANTLWTREVGGAPPFLVEWEGPIVTSVQGAAANSEGEETCVSGAVSGLRCGVVLRVGVTRDGHENMVETSVNAAKGDSGGPEFARTVEGVLIQGTLVGAEASTAFTAEPELTNGSNLVKKFPEPNNACTKITKMKSEWLVTGVPIEGVGIPSKATVVKCEEGPVTATVQMSTTATESNPKRFVRVGHATISSYEPMSQIEAVYPGQELLVK